MNVIGVEDARCKPRVCCICVSSQIDTQSLLDTLMRPFDRSNDIWIGAQYEPLKLCAFEKQTCSEVGAASP